jgi:hypothetical protein
LERGLGFLDLDLDGIGDGERERDGGKSVFDVGVVVKEVEVEMTLVFDRLYTPYY